MDIEDEVSSMKQELKELADSADKLHLGDISPYSFKISVDNAIRELDKVEMLIGFARGSLETVKRSLPSNL